MEGLDYLALFDEPQTASAVLGLLVAVVGSDGVVRDEEMALLQQLQPRRGTDDLRAWVHDQLGRPLDVDALRGQLTSEEQRWAALRLAARMAWTDQDLAVEERDLLTRVAAGLGLPGDAIERTLSDMVRISGRVGSVVDAIDATAWGDLERHAASARSSLVRLGPPADCVAVFSAEGVELFAVFGQGLAGGFREGDQLVPWADIRSYTRVPVFGAAVRIETPSGALTLADVRAHPVVAFLDRLLGG